MSMSMSNQNRQAPMPDNTSEDFLLNDALDLAQAWGEDWHKPTQARMQKAHPNLSLPELDRLDEIARAAMRHGHSLVYSMAESNDGNVNESEWRKGVLERHPWIDQRNLDRLFSTGRYYAWKDGVG